MAAIPDDKPLDREIAALKNQVDILRKALQVECTTILASDEIRTKIQSSSSPSSSSSSRKSRKSKPPPTKLQSHSAKQHAYLQQCLYRISTSVTSFKIHDPDPNAVDGGHVLGLRFEVMSRGQFLAPYYVMLNRPFSGSKHLRVHRHTVPAAIPLAGLAARHLPRPRPTDEEPTKQNLERFVRTLRREVMRYHNRLGVTADLRKSVGLSGAPVEDITGDSIIEVGIADIEAKQIKLTWADERSGRVVMDDDGKVLKVMIFGREGRDWEATKELFGDYERIEDVAKRIQEYAAR